jgi:capsular exopolysaccharide synthesis family protein
MQQQQPGNNPGPFMLGPPEEEESAFDFWGVLRRRKWLIFLCMLAGLALGGIYNSQCQKIYKSEATVTIQPKEQQFFNLRDGDSQHNSSGGFDIRHDQMIGEHNIISKCLMTYGLNELETLRELPEDEQIQEIQKNLTITQNRLEPIKYELEYLSTVPRDAQTVLAIVVSTYEKDLEDRYKDDTQDIRELLNRMTDQFNNDLIQLDSRLKSSRDQLDELIGAGDLKFSQQALVAVKSKVDAEQTRLAELTAAVARAERALENGPDACRQEQWILQETSQIGRHQIEVEDNSQEIASQKRQIDDLILQKEQLFLVRKYGAGHPQIKALDAAINERESRLVELESQELRVKGTPPEEIVRMFVVSAKQQMSDLRANLKFDFQVYAENAEKVRRIARAEQRVLELEKEREVRLDRARIADDRRIENQSTASQTNLHKGFRFGTTRPATYGQDVWPLLAVILPMGGLLGALVGFGLGCLVELADKTFHNPDQITRQLQVPLIGHVPVISQGKRFLVENSLIEPIVCTYHRPKSQVSEAFRAVRTALFFNTQGKQNSVIQVTSPTPGDGKSTLASNLAVSIAQSGKRVLLVDADMRRPRQHTTFGISSRVGFATVLAGQSEWRETMFECEEIEGLTVMPCGAKPQNPAELSSSPQVKILIEEMRQEFDFVIIDTPPMLAVTDPCPIAARVDGVILTIRIKKNVRVSAERATQLIQNLGANIIGLVVNGVGSQSGYGSQYTYGAYQAGYSYNGYGYGYGQGYGGTGKYYEDDVQGRQARGAGAKGQPQQPALLESEEV